MKEKIDILNREDFINRVIKLVELISSNKGNMTFAINGEWGCGKTFVLDEVRQRLDNDSDNRFLVIPYNCWQNDYYDEPLIAFVSALNDFIDSTRLISSDTKTKIKKVICKVGSKLLNQYIKNKTGVDFEETISTVKGAYNSASEAVDKQHEYDTFFEFKQVLASLQDELKKLSNDFTLVFFVDELDRCLPEYAIKVLERLHHVAENVPNMITVIAVDKKRLDNTVNSIFGEGCADEYLKKFIRFEIKLDNGKPDGEVFFEKFSAFYNRFDASLYGQLNYTDKFLEELFDGIDARSQEQIVEKATIFNDICFGKEKQDHSIMHMELFIATLYYYYKNDSIFHEVKTIDNIKKVFVHYKEVPPAFLDESTGFSFEKARLIENGIGGHQIIVEPSNVYMVLFLYWYHTRLSQNTEIGMGKYMPIVFGTNEIIFKNLEKLKNSIDIIKTIS